MKTESAHTNLPATMSVVSPLKPATNEQVRSKFLNMIGIESKLPAEEVDKPAVMDSEPLACAPTSSRWVNPRSQQVNCTTVPLRYDKLADERDASKRRRTDRHGGPTKPKKRIGFNESVSVVPIPMRNEYSSRVRARLWSNAMEIHENAARNTIEFASEG